MSESVNRPFEIRESYEIDHYIERITKVLPERSDADAPYVMAWTTFNTDPDERLQLQLGMGGGETTQGRWLCAAERPANPKGDYINITKYLIHVEHRVFLVKNERVSVSDASSNNKDSNDIIKMELDLGMYIPAPSDWDRMGWIIDQAQEFLHRKKGAEIAQMGKSVQNLIDNNEELS